MYRAWHMLFIVSVWNMKRVAIWLSWRLEAGTDNVGNGEVSCRTCLRRRKEGGVW